jgi:signal transduction histidine kinase
LPEEAKNIVERSHNRLNDAVGIVNEMLDSVEQDSQFFKLNFAPVDLNNLIGEIVNELSYLAKKQSVIVQISRSNNAIIVPAENNLLKPAITNIVDNAIRYSPKGTVDIEVKSSLDTAVIVVKDNGSGISKVDQSHIFERFYRGANAIAIDSNESGVGLYTTKRIIDKHKGSISFSSETGKGTTFTVTLPLK